MRDRVKNELWATTPGWSRKLLYISFLAILAGCVLPLVYSQPAEPAPALSGATPAAATGFASGGTPSTPAPAASGTKSAVPGTTTALALGLSFFVGFVVAWILRLFFRIGLIIAGLAVAAFVALKYFGVDTPDMSGLAQHAKELGEQATHQAKDVMAYVKTIVPSGMAAAVGLFAGWRRR